MTWRAVEACWPLPMTSTRKLVLQNLCFRANRDDWRAWCGLARMARETGLSERAIRNALHWLHEHGAIRAVHRPGRTTEYYITPDTYTPARGAGVTPEVGAGVIEPNPGTRCRTPRHEVPDTPARGAGEPTRTNSEPECGHAPARVPAPAREAETGGPGVLEIAGILREQAGMPMAVAPSAAQGVALAKLRKTGATREEIAEAAEAVAATGNTPSSPAYFVPILQRMVEERGRPEGRRKDGQQHNGRGSISHARLSEKDYNAGATDPAAVSALLTGAGR